MSETPNIQELLKKGIEAAREGNKAEARTYFEQVVELDDQNERGWFWMASVVESEDEKRICLKNVLQINPNNERAQKALEQIEAKTLRSRSEEEVMPGITRRQLTLAVGAGAVVIALILVIFVAITSANNSRNAEATRNAVAMLQIQTEAAATQTQVAIQATDAFLTLNPPTATPLPTSNVEFPPTWTPSPTPEALTDTMPTPLAAPPPGLGSIVGWSGRDISQIDFLPIVLYPLSGGEPTIITDKVGANPVFSPDGTRIAYTRYFSVTFDFGVSELSLSGGDNQPLTLGMPVLKPQMPSYCQTANLISFVALATGSENLNFSDEVIRAYQVYTLNLDTKDLQRLTNDDLIYTYPAFSPDCTKIAMIRNNPHGSAQGEDLIILDVASRNQTPLTTDLANFVESAPRWSPDGTKIIYAAYSATSPGNNDIIVRMADGSGTPLVPIRELSDDIYPIFSPDGRYIAFSSNRTGYYDLFIFDQVDNVTYQVTNTEDEDYPGAWKP